MARKKKKKSLIRMAAGLALRGVLKKQIVKKEQVRASAPVKGGLGILPLKSGKTGKTGKPGKSGKPVMATALYHALGGKASKEQLQEKGRKKALKRAAAVSAAAVVVHKRRQRRRLVHRILTAPVKLIALAALIGKGKKKKEKS